jgi:hypothetical protein
MSDHEATRAATEDRLRSALRSAAEAVSPGELAGLEVRIRRAGRSPRRAAPRHWRIIAPTLAGAAVAAIAVVTAGIAPSPARSPGSTGASKGTASGPATAGQQRYVVTTNGFSPLDIRDLATGRLVARIRVPQPPWLRPDPHPRAHFQIASVATADGRRWVVGLVRAKPCQSLLYQFTLSRSGEPGPLTPFVPLPAIRSAGIAFLAFSVSGRELAFSTISGTPACSYRQTSIHIGVLNLATGQTKQWSGATGWVSLDSTGRLLVYNGGGRIMAMPTSAPAGPAARYSRVAFDVRRYARPHGIFYLTVTPDSSRVYFAVDSGPGPGQIRVAAIGSDRSRLVGTNLGYPGYIAADPGVSHLLLFRNGRLVKLDLRTGRTAPLPAPLSGYTGEIFW